MNFEKKTPGWQNVGVEPPEELKKDGFKAGYKPPASYFNWFFNRISEAVKELQEKLAANLKALAFKDRAGDADITDVAAGKVTQDSTHRMITDTERASWNDANGKKHTHGNKTILDKVTQVLLDNWSAAYTHVSDTVKHVTAAERTTWNAVTNKVDKVTGKQLSTNDYTTAEKTKLAGIETGANKYVHPTGDGNKHVPATGTANNGKLLQAGSTAGALQWVAPSKTMVGLGNVDNTTDVNKPVSSAQKAELDKKVDKVSGKELSTNDYTTAEKTKLKGIAEGANKYTHPGTHAASMITQDATHRFATDTEKTKWNEITEVKQSLEKYASMTVSGETLNLPGGGSIAVTGETLSIPLKI